MEYSEYSKNIVLRALTAGKKFKFVESEQEVKAYSRQKIYAIKKDSAILKELVNEGEYPIDERILTLRKGYYHIIDIYQKEQDVKSQTKIQNIAYVLYREKEFGDFLNIVYQVKVNPLTNYISRRLFSDDDDIYNLVGKTICVFDFELNKEARSYKVTWEGVEEIEIHIKEEEYENYLIDQEIQRIEEEEAMYEVDLIEAEMERIAMEEAEAEANAMTEYIEATDEDVTIGQMDLGEENEK